MTKIQLEGSFHFEKQNQEPNDLFHSLTYRPLWTISKTWLNSATTISRLKNEAELSVAASAWSEKQHTLLSNRSIFQSARYATRVRRTRPSSRYNRAGVCALSRMHASNWAEVQIISQWLMKELPSAPFEIWRYVILNSFLLCAKGIRIINMFRINPPAGLVLLWRVVRM